MTVKELIAEMKANDIEVTHISTTFPKDILVLKMRDDMKGDEFTKLMEEMGKSLGIGEKDAWNADNIKDWPCYIIGTKKEAFNLENVPFSNLEHVLGIIFQVHGWMPPKRYLDRMGKKKKKSV